MINSISGYWNLIFSIGIVALFIFILYFFIKDMILRIKIKRDGSMVEANIIEYGNPNSHNMIFVKLKFNATDNKEYKTDTFIEKNIFDEILNSENPKVRLLYLEENPQKNIIESDNIFKDGLIILSIIALFVYIGLMWAGLV